MRVPLNACAPHFWMFPTSPDKARYSTSLRWENKWILQKPWCLISKYPCEQSVVLWTWAKQVNHNEQPQFHVRKCNQLSNGTETGLTQKSCIGDIKNPPLIGLFHRENTRNFFTFQCCSKWKQLRFEIYCQISMTCTSAIWLCFWINTNKRINTTKTVETNTR